LRDAGIHRRAVAEQTKTTQKIGESIRKPRINSPGLSRMEDSRHGAIASQWPVSWTVSAAPPRATDESEENLSMAEMTPHS